MASSIRQRLITAVIRYARTHPGQISSRQFCRSARVNEGSIHEHFPDGMRQLLSAAGLHHRVARREMVPFADLMRKLDETVRIVGRFPTHQDADRVGKLSANTLKDRLGTWKNVADTYTRWLKRTGRPFPARPTTTKPSRRAPGLVGSLLGVPDMVYAPTSETGVVYLFGVLARKLGYAVEQIGTAFPDCIALQRIDTLASRRIAVEFEFKSSNFRLHMHDPKACDLIVCWEHDWKDCPVEVVELKSKVEELRRAA